MLHTIPIQCVYKYPADTTCIQLNSTVTHHQVPETQTVSTQFSVGGSVQHTPCLVKLEHILSKIQFAYNFQIFHLNHRSQ